MSQNSAVYAAPATEQPLNETKHRLLDIAEQLFMERGYTAITLRDIAAALDIKQASLYYHFPQGKEQLFVEVVERVLERYHTGITEALTSADETLVEQLCAVVTVFLHEPPINLLGVMHADVPALTPAGRTRLHQSTYAAMFAPLRSAFAQAVERREIRKVDPDVLTGAFLSLMDGLRFRQTRSNRIPVEIMAQQLIDVLLHGLIPRPEDLATCDEPHT